MSDRCLLYSAVYCDVQFYYEFMTLLYFYYFRPGNGSPMATNVVLVLLGVVIIRFSIP